MKKNKEISDELQKLSSILKKLQGDASEPQAPDGFFDILHSNVFSAIDQLEEEDSTTEITRISPMLAEFKKENSPATASEEFYHEMQKTVLSKTELHFNGGEDHITKPAFIQSRVIRIFMGLSAAAVIILAIATTIHFLNHTEKTVPLEAIKKETIISPTVVASIEQDKMMAETTLKPDVEKHNNNLPSHNIEATINTIEYNSASREEILSYLIDNPSEINAENIADELGLTASTTYSASEINDLNNYLYENIEGLDEYELIKTTL